MISTISTVHAASKKLKPSKAISEMSEGTLAYDGPAWFTVKIAEGCVILPNADYWIPKYGGYLDFGGDYSMANCTNSPYPSGTIVALTQE